MKFDWNDYLEIADELFQDGKNVDEAYAEAKARSSISRAYYSAFCEARNYLGVEAQGAVVHKLTIEDLQNSSNKDLRKAGEILANLRKSRNKADYEDNQIVHYINKNKNALSDAKAIRNIILNQKHS